MGNKQIILYQDKTEVYIDHETIWLTQAQIAALFGIKVPAISKHIRNIYSSKELNRKASVSKMEIVQVEGLRRVLRIIDIYNLDMILSIGYRVNSIYATQFRIWANRVLKDHLLKGHSLNLRIGNLENKVEDMGRKQEDVMTFIQQSLPTKQGIFFNGEVFDAYTFVCKIIRSAKISIILIDNYIDESVLLLLSKRDPKVEVRIYTANINDTLRLDIEKHRKQYLPIRVEKFSKSHDRFLIIDGIKAYHIGASLKDLGKKWFAFSCIEDTRMILDKLK